MRTILAKAAALMFAIGMLTTLVVRAGLAGCGGTPAPTAYPPATLAAPETEKPKKAALDDGEPAAPENFLPASKAGPPVLRRPTSPASSSKPKQH